MRVLHVAVATAFFFIIVLALGGTQMVLGSSEPEIAASTEAVVKSVDVQIDGAGQVYEGLVNRIEYSVGRVGEKILLGQPLAILKKNENTIRTTIFNVFAKVLTGFQVEAVTLELGEHTKIKLRLLPLEPFIHQVKVNLQIKGITPELADFSSRIGMKAEKELNEIFVGLPVESVVWAESIINLVVNYLMEREFPGFSSHFTITAGSSTELSLVLTPLEPTISTVTVDYLSDDLPVWLIRYKAKGYQDKFGLLKGLPVEFLEHYRSLLEKYLADYVNGFPDLQHLGMDVDLKIIPGMKTKVNLAVNSRYFQTKLEARYFISSPRSFGNFLVFLGYNTGNYQLFLKNYIGTNPGGQNKIGFQVPIEPNFAAAFEYDLINNNKDLWFHYHFERGDYLGLGIGLDGAPNEANIGIYLSNNLNLEFANYDRDFGIQLMFHF